MARKTTFAMVGVFAILLLQFADCMSAMAPDDQSMQCCGSMPCDRSNQTHDCCKGMVSQSPSALPAAHVTFISPVMVAADVLPSPQVDALFEAPSGDFVVPQDSPPDLYTLHSSFLI